MVNKLAKSVEESGIRTLLGNLKREELAALATKANCLKEDDNKHNKTVLTRRLQGVIADSNIHDFLSENADEDLLKSISAAIDVEGDSDKKEDLINAVTDAVRAFGLDSFFSSFEAEQLQDVAEDLKLKTGKTANKRKLVECIVNKKDAEKEPKAKKQRVEASKKKQEIEKGVTYEDIFQHYYVTEVRQWCKDHGLKTSGKKGALIRRILAYLDGDESVKSLPPGQRAKKRKGKGKSRKGNKKAAEKKESDGEKDDKKGK